MLLHDNDIVKEPKMKQARQSEGEGKEDLLSGLPDCVLLHILTFMKTKDAVQTCILSRRWKDLWKQVPSLILNSLDFRKIVHFSKFVYRVLSFRDGSIALHSLDFRRVGHVEPQLLKRIIRYAVSHNVQQLRLHVSFNLVLPPCFFSCESLTSLQISVSPNNRSGTLPKSLEFPALMSLHLENLQFSKSDKDMAEPFSSCNKLKSLVILSCDLYDANTLCISNPKLASLTISIPPHYHINKVVLSTPNLSFFLFMGVPPQQWCGQNISFLEAVYINADFCLSSTNSKREAALTLISMLQVLASVKLVTVSPSTLQVLSIILDLPDFQLPCLGNLKSVNFKLKASSQAPDVNLGFLFRNSVKTSDEHKLLKVVSFHYNQLR